MCVCSGGANYVVGCDKIKITKLSNYVESYVSLNK